MSSARTAAVASRLCTVCGLCCNGVLFHIVRLQPADSVKQLEALGAKVSRKKREPYFKQPCSFLKDCTCSNYAARPVRCRLFECRQLQRLADQQITEDDVMLAIGDVKRRVAKVEAMLEQAGNTSMHLPLSERYEQVLASPGHAGTTTARRHLIAEMTGLNQVLNHDFRREPGEGGGATGKEGSAG
jgi:uncharacterized protein